ncbi:MAG: enoyl-CoA hydratase/isomerase family protein [Gemmatimonadales bacterium]
MAEPLLVTAEAGVLTLTLNRPEKRNALNRAMVGALLQALARAELDREVRVVAVRGAGRDFCAGADLDELLASGDRDIADNERDALALGEIFLALRRLPKPAVAVVHGRALAGGAGIATACDIVLAADDAHFGYPEVRRGFVPAMVMTMLRRATGEKRAFELVATGRTVPAGEGLVLGLVSRVVPAAELDGSATDFLRELAAIPPNALALAKELFYELDDRTFADGILLGARVNALARATPEFRSAVTAFLKR